MKFTENFGFHEEWPNSQKMAKPCNHELCRSLDDSMSSNFRSTNSIIVIV